MAFWLVNREASTVLHIDNRLYIASRRPVRINQYDHVLFSENEATTIRPMLFEVGRTSLLWEGERPDDWDEVVRGFAQKGLPVGDYRDFYRYDLHAVQRVTHPLVIKDFHYSLRIVTRLDAPQVHFRFPYREIPRVDVQTLLKGRIYLSRTAYYTLYYALPQILRARIDHEERLAALANPPDIRVTYRDRLERLIRFIETEIVPVGRMLRVAGSHWEQLAMTRAIPFADAVFADPDTGNPASAGVQLERFNALFAELDGQARAMEAKPLAAGRATERGRDAPARHEHDFFPELLDFMSRDGNEDDERFFERIFPA